MHRAGCRHKPAAPMSDATRVGSTEPARLWVAPDAPPALHIDEVHVWRVWLDIPAGDLDRRLSTLTVDEQDRARRFHFEVDRARFVVARATLRAILGQYLAREPGAVRFRYGAHGKPALNDDAVADPLRFNLSHSAGVALCAVTRGREVGVDVERIDSRRADDGIVRRFLSPHESHVFFGLAPHERVDAFFRCWTRKEAYIKARGDGVALSLAEFDVSLAPGDPPALLRTRHDPRDALRWTLRDLAVGAGFAGALAAEGGGWRLCCWQWRGSD